ncbi:MAG: ATP-binding protein [Isosphaeraceae bacterium]
MVRDLRSDRDDRRADPHPVPPRLRGRVLEFYAFRLGGLTDGGIAVLFRDVSERKAVEQQLLDADRRKDEFLATLAHELRNPLAPISNSLQLLRMCFAEDPTVGEVCEVMERQLNHMVRLVDDLLEVSRITRGSIELRKEPSQLASILRSALELSRPLIETLEHQLAIAIPPAPIPIEADPVRLGQVFANLLNNAAKYTDRGGHIRLGVRVEGGEAVVTVRDTGIGLAEDKLATIFDMFTQVERGSDRSRGGLGIGLTLARRLVEMHGGSITAHSAGPGQGSEFVVRLPVAPVENPIMDLPPERRCCELHRRRVLVVDDNQDSAATLGRLLQVLGTDVQIAHDGPTALEMVEGYSPDVVFLDLGMPGMDGLEVARRIRQSSPSRSIVLIALTGWGQHGDRLRTRDAGFDHHLVKPANMSALQSLLS